MVDKELLEQAVKSFMYKHPVGGHDMKHGIAVLTVMVMVLGLPISAIVLNNPSSANASVTPPKGSQADDGQMTVSQQSVFPKIVDGTVRDLVGTPIGGASVTVTMMNGTTVTGTQTYTTVLDGFYTVTFQPAEWNAGYTITVSVTKGPEIGWNSTAADSEPFQTVDVTLGVVIPEISGLTVVGVPLFVAALAAIFFRRRTAGR